MMAACVLEMLGDEDAKPLRGRMLGSKNVRRTRKKVKNLWAELGCYARKAYRMSMEAFGVLHDTIFTILSRTHWRRSSNPRMVIEIVV